jgi:hypothetical protein
MARRTARGDFSITVSSTSAGPSGVRRPCSQFRTVPRLTPNAAANCSWDSPSFRAWLQRPHHWLAPCAHDRGPWLPYLDTSIYVGALGVVTLRRKDGNPIVSIQPSLGCPVSAFRQLARQRREHSVGPGTCREKRLHLQIARAVPEVPGTSWIRYPRSSVSQTVAGAGAGHNTVNRLSWGCPGRKLMLRSRGLPSMADAGRTFPWPLGQRSRQPEWPAPVRSGR